MISQGIRHKLGFIWRRSQTQEEKSTACLRSAALMHTPYAPIHKVFVFSTVLKVLCLYVYALEITNRIMCMDPAIRREPTNILNIVPM